MSQFVNRLARYDPTLCQAIADRIAEGETLASICREPGMPDRSTINKFRRQHPDIGVMFDEARDAGFDVIADRLRAVARGAEGSTGNVIRDKLVVETDLKLLAKWDPRRYGDSITLKGDRDNPLASNVQDMSEAELRKIVHEAKAIGDG